MASVGNKIRVAVIGVGGMGKRWSQVVKDHDQSTLVAVCNPDAEEAASFGRQFDCKAYTDWHAVLQQPNIDAIVVSTPHVLLTQIAKAALEAGKHVFTEKPGGISSSAIQEGVAVAKRNNLRYRVNFNMRLHPAVVLAKEKINEGVIGPLMFMRAVYGHGAREGYEKEWWCDEKISGGGELIDQSSHLIDLANWFLGPFTGVSAFLETAFWEIAPMEDNAFVMLSNSEGRIASLHASWTHWKKMFRLELFGEEGYLIVEGLGGQYGLERLTFGPRTFGREAPPEKIWEFPQTPGVPDEALKNSWNDFALSVREGRDIGPTARDAHIVLKMIEAGYISAREHRTVDLV